MFCVNCGSKLTPSARFCANCGTANVIKSIPEQPIATSTPSSPDSLLQLPLQQIEPASKMKEVKVWKTVFAVIAVLVLIIGGLVIGAMWIFNFGLFESTAQVPEIEFPDREFMQRQEYVPEPVSVEWGRLSHFSVSWGRLGEESWLVSITEMDGQYVLNASANDDRGLFVMTEIDHPISEEVVEELINLLQESNIDEWHGFMTGGEDFDVMGDNFSMIVHMDTDFFSVVASNVFPDNYDEVAPIIISFLMELALRYNIREERIGYGDWRDLEISPTSPPPYLRWGLGELSPDGIFNMLEIVYDLDELKLFNHDLTDKVFFYDEPLESSLGNTYMVSMPIESLRDAQGVVTHDSPRIFYDVIDMEYREIFDAVTLLEEWFKQILDGDRMVLPFGPMRVNQDRTIAILPLRVFAMGDEMTQLLFAQVIPENNEIISLNYFTWAIQTDYFAEDRYAAIVEFSELVGIEIFEYFDGLRIFRFEWFGHTR